MTRLLRLVDGSRPAEVLVALRAALSGDGPAVLPITPAPGRRAQFGSSHRAGGGSPADFDRLNRRGDGHGGGRRVARERDRVPLEVPRAVALVIETSGSTEAPKRVALSTDALLASAAASAAALGGAGQWLLALPAHYIAGAQVLVRSIAAGTDPLILPPGGFDPIVFGEHSARMTGERTFTSLVPVQLSRVLDAAVDDARLLAALQHFDRILVGGQAVPPALLERAEALDIVVTRTYGSSETAGGCVYDGVPIGNTRMRVVGGLVELSGAVLAQGYVGDPERTEEAFPEHDGRRWYRTGDLGELDAEGRLRVLGRADNVIISGGEKVSIDAVELVVRRHPGFEHAVVVAADDARWGQAPVVVTEAVQAASAADDPNTVPNPTAAFDSVRRFVSARLGVTARPRELVIVDSMPMLSSGKPDRRALSALVADRAS
ncbi:AMP-binding protein [Luethyella okanaganae]|uniref:AMP-binding protein n=1 Tax=Luethyella okanaganae TaxID=69372 RepID=A0ABW1VHU5_9MICO